MESIDAFTEKKKQCLKSGHVIIYHAQSMPMIKRE